MAGCDLNGTFNVNGMPPKDVILEYNSDEIKKVSNCFIFRNDKNWFSYCKDICNEFTIATLPKFFDG